MSRNEFNSKFKIDELHKYSLILENGAKVDNVQLIEHNDQILMEDISKFDQPWDPIKNEEGFKVPSYYSRPCEYYSPFNSVNGGSIYIGYPFHPIPPVFTPIYLSKGENSRDLSETSLNLGSNASSF